MSVIIAPSILSADFANLESEIKKIEKFGADWVHVDVMDGHFVPNITFGAPVVKAVRKVTKLPLDVHLMIENPQKYIPDFIDAGSDYITIHSEIKNPIQALKMIKKAGIKTGISIKPATEPEMVLKFQDLIDLVLVMTVEPGFGGQSFIGDCANKIKFLKEKLNNKIIIEVDGGINAQSAKVCVQNGADALVSGNYIFKSEDIKQAIESLRFA